MRPVRTLRLAFAPLALAFSSFVFTGCPDPATQVVPCAPAAALPSTADSARVSAVPPGKTSLRDTPIPAQTRVVVVGGGLGGLVTAYQLKKEGVDVHLLEASDRIGGRVNTAYYPDGAQGEFGLQEVWSDNPLYAISKELGVKFEAEGAGEQAYSSFIYQDPATPKAVPKLYSFTQKEAKKFFQTFLLHGNDQAKANRAYEDFEKWLAAATKLRERAITVGLADPEVKRVQGISFEDWIKEAKLDPKVAEFIQMTSDCEIGVQWHQYGALFGLIEFGLFLDEEQNYHAQGGNHKIPEAIADYLAGHVTTSARVDRISRPATDRPQKGEVSVEYMRDGHISVIKADRVVLAVPWMRIHEIEMYPPLSEAKWDSLNYKNPLGLQRGQYVVVHLLVDRKEGDLLWRDKTTHRAPFPVLSNGPLGVIYGVRGEGDPKAATEVFGLLVYGKYAVGMHMKSTEEVQKLLVTELEKLWPGFGKVVRGAYVYSYHPAGVPVWPPGRSPIDEQSKVMFKPEHGLHLVGDFLLNAHSDGSVRSAICAAERISKDFKGEKVPTGLCFYAPKE